MLGPSFSLDALCTECRDAVTSRKIVLYKEILRILRTHGTMNFKHLHYFWRVAKAGGVARASSCTCAQTISGPLGLLEDDLGAPLFAKSGRSLELTDAGRLAFGYAQDIRTGRSLLAGSAARIGQRPATGMKHRSRCARRGPVCLARVARSYCCAPSPGPSLLKESTQVCTIVDRRD